MAWSPRYDNFVSQSSTTSIRDSYYTATQGAVPFATSRWAAAALQTSLHLGGRHPRTLVAFWKVAAPGNTRSGGQYGRASGNHKANV